MHPDRKIEEINLHLHFINALWANKTPPDKVPASSLQRETDQKLPLVANAKTQRSPDEKAAISRNIDEQAKARRMAHLEAKKLKEQEPPEQAFIKACVWRDLEPYISKDSTPENEQLDRPSLPKVILNELKTKFPGKSFDPDEVTRYPKLIQLI